MPTTATDEIAIQLERRRQAAAVRWALGDEIVLIGAGEPIAVPGRGDRTYPFRAHSEYFYLTDRDRPGGVLAFDPAEGWVDFVVPVTREEVLWEGAPAGGVEGTPVAELERWLAVRAGRGVAALGSPLAAIASEPRLTDRLRRGLNHVRRPKDAVELARMRHAAEATRAGFARLRSLVEPGRTERELQIELEAEFRRGGAAAAAFDTIVASGPNAAVLHFAPSERRLGAGELLLVDAGLDYLNYASDVTRTYPVSGTFDARQQAIHELVVRAHDAAVARCTPGTEWSEVHHTAALAIAEGLVDFGLLRGGTPDGLIQAGAVALFFPHGIGHMVGLGVRDASELLPGREPDPVTRPGLRVDLPLDVGHVVTVEPGVYIVPALLAHAAQNGQLRAEVDFALAERMSAFGGVRYENDVLVTASEPEILTGAIPPL